MAKKLHYLSGLAVCAAVLCAAAAPAAEQTWSVGKLPGCDNLPVRMAGYYEPVKVEFTPAVKPYELPLNLAKLSNAEFAKALYELRDPAVSKAFSALLTRNAFAVVAGRSEDVPGFYKDVKMRGLPIFVTSDSLLHLYHIQFDETLKDIEEREFFNDAVAISKAVQAEAIKLHEASEGDLKAAAKLLVGYATVPVVVLSQSDLGAEAAEALEEVNAWPARPNWRRQQAFYEKYDEVLKAIAPAGPRRRPASAMRPADLKKALSDYSKAHPAKADPGKLIPKIVDKQVRAELDLIAAHEGFNESPMFTYKEDYSQYVPRGHYTRSKKLKQYFKALMWYGRMTFIIRGKTADIDGVISLEEAKIQTIAACMLAGMMEGKLADGRTLAAAWDRLYSVTAYYVGLADDLTPYEYRQALRDAIGEKVTGANLTNAQKFFDLRKKLAELRKPEIYSGLGDIEGPPADIATEADLAKALAMTQGLRLMGQRYIPDSYMMGKMVYPTVGLFTGQGSPFTLVRSRGGPIRGFPRGLDVMTVLGSGRARHWIKQLGDDQYQRFDARLGDLKGKFDGIPAEGWNRNMYWSWLHTLRALLKEYPSGYPTFMQSEAWQDKQLSAALASWSQLRHDTILYAKQSYTMRAGSAPQRPKMVEGYIEPVPEFYARLLALTRMTLKGLDEFKVLDDRSRGRLAALEGIVKRLLDLSVAELSNKKLTDEDYAFIRSFGDQLSSVVAGVNKQGTETTIIADVHTEGNSRQVLEEGTGYLHMMVVVYPMPDGGLVAGVGPVLSHYEFKHPMSNRLTDEAWKQMLRGGKAPALPEWAQPFTVQPGAAKPAPAPAGPALRMRKTGP
ncbi:MAG TPA: DUF3160 domain-containing protein [Phycisphaerae bacterium]|nr:DUF3160 domain-containing protein [Phycisphaerae bacterium]HUT59833.1 DUF3160 domain-containing protein [Phycisphaerae bacterium]